MRWKSSRCASSTPTSWWCSATTRPRAARHHRHPLHRAGSGRRRLPHVAVCRHGRSGRGRAAPLARHELQERHGRAAVRRRQGRDHRRLARDKTPQLFEAFGRFVDSLGGPLHHRRGCRHDHRRHGAVARARASSAGSARAPGEAGGTPGPKTALGVFLGIKAAVRFRSGRSDLEGLERRGAGRRRRRLSPVPACSRPRAHGSRSRTCARRRVERVLR